MSKPNRRYLEEFKRQALELAATGEYTMAEVERKLGITKGLLKSWRRKAEMRGEDPLQQRRPRTVTEAEARIRQLERENSRLKLEQEILKKAVAIFSNPRA